MLRDPSLHELRHAHGRYDLGVSLREPWTRSAHPALRLAGLLVVLAGLFGMHGLSGQLSGKSSAHDPVAVTMRTALPAPQATSVMGINAADVAAISVGIVSDAVPSTRTNAQALLEIATGSNHGGMAMGAMCLAVLGTALLGLLRLLQRAWVAPVMWRLPRPSRAVVPRGRDPDPPSLITLSIQRC